jgi:hypothetical protein
MKMRGLGIIFVLVGIALLIMSWFWTGLTSGRQNWSEEQAKEYADTLADVHRLSGQLAAEQLAQARPGNSQAAQADARLADSTAKGKEIDPATATADRVASELEATKARNQQLREALDMARTGGQGAATVMRWLGICLAVVGAISLLSARSEQAG